MKRQKRRSGPVQEAAPRSRFATTDTRTITRPVVPVSAVTAPPAPGRTRYLLIVLACPHCHLPEVRYADAAALFAGEVVRRCPRTRGRYRVLPEARKAVAA